MHKAASDSPELSEDAFFQRFADEDACLDHIMQMRFGGTRFPCGGCGRDATHHKLAARRTFVCASCGHHVNPTAGTILHDARIPLVSWFYAIYLVGVTPDGISARELQRRLGVTYKTAYRVRHLIRDLTATGPGFDALLAEAFRPL